MVKYGLEKLVVAITFNMLKNLSTFKLGERREPKIQLPHLRYPKLLFLPKPFSVTGAP